MMLTLPQLFCVVSVLPLLSADERASNWPSVIVPVDAMRISPVFVLKIVPSAMVSVLSVPVTWTLISPLIPPLPVVISAASAKFSGPLARILMCPVSVVILWLTVKPPACASRRRLLLPARLIACSTSKSPALLRTTTSSLLSLLTSAITDKPDKLVPATVAAALPLVATWLTIMSVTVPRVSAVASVT